VKTTITGKEKPSGSPIGISATATKGTEYTEEEFK